MDYRQKAFNVIKEYYSLKKGLFEQHSFIHDVCDLFDLALRTDIDESDYRFLKFISSEIGIPQYYDLLVKQKNVPGFDYNLSSLRSDIQNWPLITDDNSYLHRYQKRIVDSFQMDKRNRYFLSAPTSFGKTYVLFEIIKKMQYRDVLLIFPTIALLSENQLRIIEYQQKNQFWNQYSLHTLSEDSGKGEQNIWLFTPERYLSFLDNNPYVNFDFCFMDEIYKIDNQFIVDGENVAENERDISFRVALHYICERAKDILLAGPFISFPNSNAENESISIFMERNGIEKMDYNQYEIVNKTNYNVYAKESVDFNGEDFQTTTKDRAINLERLLRKIGDNEETIVYCSTKSSVEHRAKALIKLNLYDLPENQQFNVFLEHIKNAFSSNWIFYRALRCGIGIHHGSIPKYIQKEVIKYFNIGLIKCIITTTTIIEGINTTAKNIIVYDYLKGKKQLKHFDAQNIAGRAGRFTYHFSGRVISLNNEFVNILNNDSEGCIKHIDYDISSIKKDSDLDIASDEFLNESDKERKKAILKEAQTMGFSIDVLNQYKSVSKQTKIDIYKKIQNLSNEKIKEIKKIGERFTFYNNFYYSGFDVLVKTMKNSISEENLCKLIEVPSSNNCCLLTWLTKAYFDNGFMGIVRYKIDVKKETYDRAMRETANLVFNTFKYQLSKYLGVFDLLLRYKVWGPEEYNDKMVLGGIAKKLEYGYVNDKARKANDFGVPFDILRFLEQNDESIKDGFDEYEKSVFENIDKYIG